VHAELQTELEHEVDDAADGRAEEWRQLIGALAEMGSMQPNEYKASMRRLYLTYHSDKCTEARRPYANRFFDICRMHCALYDQCHEQGDFEPLHAYMRQLTDGGLEAAMASTNGETGATNASIAPHTWWQQFEDELVAAVPTPSTQSNSDGRRAANPSYRMTGYNPHHVLSNADGKNDDSEPEEMRLSNTILADVCWQSAQKELEVSKVLVRSFPAQSVMHSHCAAEQVLKYALLKTSGLKKSEYSGSKAHDLVALMAQIKEPRPDVMRQRLQRLADAFEATRYATFPPSGVSTLPAKAFGVEGADEMYGLASYLIDWARSALPVYGGLARQPSASRQPSDSTDGQLGAPAAPAEASTSSAELAAAEARARTAEQELLRLKESLQTSQSSVEEEVERERRILQDQHLSEREDLEKQHKQEVDDLHAEHNEIVEKLNKKIKQLKAALAADDD